MKIINVEKKIGGFVLETGCVQMDLSAVMAAGKLRWRN